MIDWAKLMLPMCRGEEGWDDFQSLLFVLRQARRKDFKFHGW